ncbi:MAG TPA: aminotransferase class III-fold pyridoxal phosphate-dependent enzyme, partial [Gemmatimonadaceae bacterium]|nr:aminotransferase class III-fold pyridoxal phosphate-dependent enzyme [Gemmatimonadaceae bacterium]
ATFARVTPPPHRYPDSPVFYRSLTRDYPLVVRGEGCWLEDETGKRYLDAVGGAFVASIGHGVPEIGEAMARQAGRVAYVNGTAFTNEAVEGLAARLVARTPALGKAYFLGSGSEAVEAALKLARQHWIERGRPSKHRVIALAPGYHGNTMLALSASAREHYRRYWREWLVDVRRIPAPFAYRCSCEGRGDCPACSGEALEGAILEEGSENVAAFILEPVGGSSTGGNVPRDGYLRAVREICDRHEVLLVADEVLCGAGRTGTWTATEAWGVVPDILTLGKGIGGGYAPVSAVLARDEVVAPLAAGSGYLMHAQTFSHHAVTCAAAVATLDHMERHQLVARCARMGAILHQRLQRLLELPGVGDVRGRGLLAGVEFVADKATRAPFPRAERLAERFTAAAQEAGLIVWPNVGQADGVNGDLAMLAPPFIITEEEIDEIVERFSRALRRVT